MLSITVFQSKLTDLSSPANGSYTYFETVCTHFSVMNVILLFAVCINSAITKYIPLTVKHIADPVALTNC